MNRALLWTIAVVNLAAYSLDGNGMNLLIALATIMLLLAAILLQLSKES